MNRLEAKLFESRSFVDPETGCREWTGFIQSGGYGQVEIDGTLWLAHRAAWTLSKGRIPSGLLVLHRCDNPRCIEVEHLFLGTHADNFRDAVEKGRHPGRPPEWASRKSRILKLTDDEVRSIRAYPREIKDSEIAGKFGVSRTTVLMIRNRKRKQLVPDVV